MKVPKMLDKVSRIVRNDLMITIKKMTSCPWWHVSPYTTTKPLKNNLMVLLSCASYSPPRYSLKRSLLKQNGSSTYPALNMSARYTAPEDFLIMA